MLEGTWNTPIVTPIHHFDNKYEGRSRAFVFRQKKEFQLYDPLLREASYSFGGP
jgi:hypothetical protein